nr:MAG TPA: hypothetical protein [Caudoviricetes sp.]
MGNRKSFHHLALFIGYVMKDHKIRPERRVSPLEGFIADRGCTLL